jgi:hypothetical protein
MFAISVSVMKKSKEIQPITLPIGRQADRNAFVVWLGLSFCGTTY